MLSTLLGNDTVLLEIPFAGIWTGVVFLRRQGKNILIDSGNSAENVDKWIVPALAEQGVTPADIDYLLATHTHGDHVGGHLRLRELGAKCIAIASSGADKMRDPLKYNIAIRAVFPQYSAPPSTGLKGVEPDLILEDGDEIAGVRMIATPGHDSDAVAYFDTATGTLFTGDSIQGNGTATQGCALYMDLPSYEKSLHKLAAMPIEQVVTGHPFFPWENAVVPGKKAITDSIALLDKYDDILKAQNISDIAERVPALISELGGVCPQYLFLGMYTVREHLRRAGME